MCRSIRVLYNFEPPTTADEIRAAALQFVRKVSGLHKPSAEDAHVFDHAVDHIAEHTAELRALSTDLSACRSRADLDALLSPEIPDPFVRQFILTNAVRDGEGFRWRIDASILASSTVAGDFARVSGTFGGPALLVAGGKSSYVDDEGREAMRRHFPAGRIVTIPEADHWLHVSAPQALHDVLDEFLARTAGSAAMQ